MQQTLLIDGLKNRRLPINLRQSGNSDARMLISTRIRKSPLVAPVQGRRLLGLYHL